MAAVTELLRGPVPPSGYYHLTEAEAQAILTELEQAEATIRRERDATEELRQDAIGRLEQAERERDGFSLKYSQTGNDLDAAEARLAKVPALVEALQSMVNYRSTSRSASTAWQVWVHRARAALAAWENERPATPPGVTQGNATGPQLIGGVPWENE